MWLMLICSFNTHPFVCHCVFTPFISSCVGWTMCWLFVLVFKFLFFIFHFAFSFEIIPTIFWSFVLGFTICFIIWSLISMTLCLLIWVVSFLLFFFLFNFNYSFIGLHYLIWSLFHHGFTDGPDPGWILITFCSNQSVEFQPRMSVLSIVLFEENNSVIFYGNTPLDLVFLFFTSISLYTRIRFSWL